MLNTAGSVITAAISSPRSAITLDEALGVVPGEHDQRVGELRRARPGPTATGRGWSAGPASVGIDVVAPVHDVLPAVVVALEAHEQATPGDGAREAHGCADRLAAGVGEAHLLDARHGLDDLLGGLDLELVGHPEAGAQRRRSASWTAVVTTGGDGRGSSARGRAGSRCTRGRRRRSGASPVPSAMNGG